MARLISIEAEDFAGFRYFELELAKQGLTFVAGDNRDSEAASSNGACKTGLFKAIGWGLYGQAIDKRVGDEVIHVDQKCARVSIAVEDGGDTYLIVRERRKQSPKLLVEQNGEPLKRSNSDLQRVIDNLIGTDWEGFRNTVLYGQRDRDRFVYPTTKDRERKAILHRILRTGVFELAHAEAKKRRLAMEKERDAAADEVRRHGERIGDVDLDALQTRADGFAEENREKVAALVEEARTLADRAKKAVPPKVAPLKRKLKAVGEDIVNVQARAARAKEAMAEARKAYRAADDNVARLRAESDVAASALELLDGDQCPTCTGDLAKGRAATHKGALEARTATLARELAGAQNVRKKAAQAVSQAEGDLERAEDREETLADEARDLWGRIKSADTEKEKAADLARQAREKAADARVLRDAPNPYLVDLETATEKVGKLKRARKKALRAMEALTEDLAHLEFWARGFGPTGLPSFALDAVMPFITERSNHYLKTLSDGDITINFSTQRELKSTAGELRDEIGITWFIEGIENYPPSGGQWKKMEVATNFALMDLVATREGSHVNILCLDECLDGMDREGRRRVVDLLHKLRSQRESIFVISHDSDLSEVFERTLTVIKEDGVSRLEKAT